MPEDDIRSAAEAAFAEVEASQAPESTPVVESVSPETTETTTDDKPSRARDETGKFAKQEPTDPKPAADAKVKSPDLTDKAAVADKDKPLGTEPPSNWSAADKATFKALPPEGQEFLLRRHRDMEADHTRKTQEISQYRKEYERVDSLLSPHAEAMAAKGFTKSSIIEAWYTVEKQLMEGKGLNVIKGLVDGYKIPPAEVARVLGLTGAQTAPSPVNPAQNPAPRVDPATEAELNALRTRLNGIEQKNRLDAENAINQTLERFIGEVGDDGQPLHPYFSELEADMAALIQVARASNRPIPSLSELYEKTVWANPETRAKLLASQRDAEQKKEREQARAKAEAAKKASSSVRGAPGSGQAPETRRGSGSLKDDLRAALEDVA